MTGIVGLFLSTGVMGVNAAVISLFLLIGAQSFFQGLSVIMEGVGGVRLLGDPSVTDEERNKANSIMTFVSSAMSITAPICAALLAGLIPVGKKIFGKDGISGALIYGLYAVATGLTGLIYSTVKIFKDKPAAAQVQAGAQAPAKFSWKGALKEIFVSLGQGFKLIGKDRFLSTQVVLALIASFFSDILIFTVLPEYVENVASAGLGSVLNIPVLGWFVKTLTSTAMGSFSMLAVASYLGLMLGSLLNDPVGRLLGKLGFKNEASKTIPLYVLAALEIPLFWLMIATPSLWAVLGLYGLQALVTAFGSIVISGLTQKRQGTYGEQIGKVLAAQSFIAICAGIAATVLFGSVFRNVPIAVLLKYAAIATTALGLMRLISPWTLFSKSERQRNLLPPESGK
jgi:hypothetical protein